MPNLIDNIRVLHQAGYKVYREGLSFRVISITGLEIVLHAEGLAELAEKCLHVVL